MVRSQHTPDTTISGLAREGGVGVETIRYYQRRGLLETPQRSGGMRRYGAADLHRLRFIRSAQAAGFTLEEIAELIALDATEDRPRALILARDRLAALDARIAEMTSAREALARLARACGSDVEGPGPILTAFDES